MNEKIFSWAELQISEKLEIKAIYDTPVRKEVAILMPENAQMKEHSAPGEIVVQVLSGRIEFCVQGECAILSALTSIKLDANVPHSLKALEPSIVRLSLAKNDSINRVHSLIVK